MIKPAKLQKGDLVATVSPSWGCAGAKRVLWQYRLGCERLKELGLRVVPAPNSLRGTAFLRAHPEARADDLMWAFSNKEVKAVVANIGGNDCEKLLPFLSPETIRKNPKILCGYSDVLALHLYCFRLGLCTFYGDNLLTNIAENGAWHPYSRFWFEKTFFDEAPPGRVTPSADWSYDPSSRVDKTRRKTYVPNPGCLRVQGSGRVQGRLFGGHGDLRTLRMPDGSPMARREDFEDAILFFEDIPELCDEKYMADFFDWLGQSGFLRLLKGVVIGKMRTPGSFRPYADALRGVVSGKYGLRDLPIVSGLNFGHTSPICVLPYGVKAELDADALQFTISESGVM